MIDFSSKKEITSCNFLVSVYNEKILVKIFQDLGMQMDPGESTFQSEF